MSWEGTEGRCQTVHTCRSATPDLFDTHPQPPGTPHLANALACRCREQQRRALHKCYAKSFLPLARQSVFVRHWNPALLRFACRHNFSCPLQTICRYRLYFRSVFRLAGHSWRDRPEINESHARTGPVFQDHSGWVCLQIILPTLLRGWHPVRYPINYLTAFRLVESKVGWWNLHHFHWSENKSDVVGLLFESFLKLCVWHHF